jgi:ABC-type multidrug transport system fused ATPase/permease subunit
MPASRDQAEDTRRLELPDETGSVPVSVAYAETRWFGVPPPLLLLGVAAASFAVAIVLFAVGSWPVGLVLLGLSALLAAAFLETARRRPDSAFTRASAGAAGGARTWASTQLDLVRARSRAIAEVQRVRATRSVIESERRMAALRLGEALSSEDGEAAEAARERLLALEQAENALDGREEAWKAQAAERIRRVRFSAQETMVVMPEPSPPPDDDSRRPAA